MKNVNISLKVLKEFLQEKEKYFVEQKMGHQGIPDSYGEMQCEYNEFFKYYRHPNFPENLYFKETYHTDSYDNNELLKDQNFLTAVTKTIITYEE